MTVIPPGYLVLPHFVRNYTRHQLLYSGQQTANVAVSFCSSVRRFRQKAVCWGSVLVRQFAASEGSLCSTSIAVNPSR